MLKRLFPVHFQNELAKEWVLSGVPANQIVIGLAFYGRSFKLQNANYSMPGAPAMGPGSDGGEGIPVNKVRTKT